MAELKEIALNFGPEAGLVGILTRPPTDRPADSGPAVVILNAGVLHRVGPNRMHVRLARVLAAAGTPCFRFDLPGVGDSHVLSGGGSLLEDSIAGMKAALDVLERHGVAKQFIVFGLCSGADHAFILACADPRVMGIALVDPTLIPQTWKAHALRLLRWSLRPVVWYRFIRGRYAVLRGIRLSLERADGNGNPPPTVEKRRIRAHLAKLIDRGVRICYIITGQRRGYMYRRQFLDAFTGIGLEAATRIEVFPEAGHTFTRDADRLRLEATIADWVASLGIVARAPSHNPEEADLHANRGRRRSRGKVLLAVLTGASSMAAQVPPSSPPELTIAHASTAEFGCRPCTLGAAGAPRSTGTGTCAFPDASACRTRNGSRDRHPTLGRTASWEC